MYIGSSAWFSDPAHAVRIITTGASADGNKTSRLRSMFCCLHTLTEFDPYRTYAVRDIVKGNDYIDMFQLCRSCQRFSWVSSNPIW
jgi:hypothetical protein